MAGYLSGGPVRDKNGMMKREYLIYLKRNHL